MNKHTGRTESDTIKGRYIEVMPSGHATIYQDGAVVIDIIIKEELNDEQLQGCMRAAQIVKNAVEVPVSESKKVLLNSAHVTHIASMVSAIGNAQRGGRQRDGVRLRSELQAAYPSLTWNEMRAVMVWGTTGKTLQANGSIA